jgi:hypothetical protein
MALRPARVLTTIDDLSLENRSTERTSSLLGSRLAFYREAAKLDAKTFRSRKLSEISLDAWKDGRSGRI